MNNMDQEYKADLRCPKNTSAAEVDNSVDKLTGDSTVRNVGNDEISPEDSQSNESTSSSNDQSNSANPLKRKNVHVVSITHEEQHSKKSKLEESKPEINHASDQEVRQENKEDEISDDNVSGIQDIGDQNEDTCTLKDSVVIETDESDRKSDDVVNVANQDEDPLTSTSTATVIKRPEAETLPKLYRLLNDGDILKNGLVAKNPYDWKISVAEHVALGTNGEKSRYISTCSSLDAAQHFRYLKARSRRFGNGRKDIAEIDVSKLPIEVKIIDLRTDIDRDRYELQNRTDINRKFHRFASAHSEVLLVGKVPPKCLALI